MCVSIKMNEITISLPLLMHSSAWSAPVETSKVAHSLFLCFVQDMNLRNAGWMPLVVRHKKEEVELQNVHFVEAQCRSDRPGFAVVDCDNKQRFKLYNAMGLSHQHSDLRTLLARMRSTDLAAMWCKFLAQETPCHYRTSQVKGDEESLTHWGWQDAVARQSLQSSAPLPNLPDWLLQNM
eukprot:s155_g4.t1